MNFPNEYIRVLEAAGLIKVAYDLNDAVQRAVSNPLGSVASREDLKQDPVQNLKVMLGAAAGGGLGIALGRHHLGNPDAAFAKKLLAGGTAAAGSLVGANYVRGTNYEQRNPVKALVKGQLGIDYYS